MKPKNEVLYKCYVGSKAHGLYMSQEEFGDKATCDIDIMEFYAMPVGWYYSIDAYHARDTKLTSTRYEGEYDITSHEIRKAMVLLAKGNPNMLVALFNNPDNILLSSPQWELIIQNRPLFLAKDSIRQRFIGYAFDQLSRMQNGAYRGYMGAKRKEIADEFGYDTKNAMVLIRLLNEGIEALNTGNITVDKRVQGTRDYYLSIKLGEWTLEQVKDEAARLNAELDEAWAKSKLPKSVDMRKLNELSQAVVGYNLSRGTVG